ncbi:MAG: metallophosphoesterase family protein [Opitutaceae bacterium]|nr:metallophosphoesterase family protein [Opitutaceae bacterium]
MRIAVLADTHDRYPPGLPERMRGADEIWHLGDVCNPATLVEFEQLGASLHIVRGNCDWNFGWPLDLTLQRGGLRFLLVHVPPARPPRGVKVVLHGHTHLPCDEVRGGVRWLNPGCVSRPHRGASPSFAWLTVEKGQPPVWKMVFLQ